MRLRRPSQDAASFATAVVHADERRDAVLLAATAQEPELPSSCAVIYRVM